MPAWGGSLSEDLSRSALAFIREGLEAWNAEPITASSLVGDSGSASEEVERGEKLFLTFCGGCHGFNGIAYYVKSPSFVLGDRMKRSTEELERSIRNGKGIMPSWGSKLSDGEIKSLVAFIQTLQPSYERGIEIKPRDVPSLYFRFPAPGREGR
jgi:mono/diheme cytochrome c family protein